ncbi:MAG: hypothetical protein Pg6C_20170 [Treponemataceae bacterium]|nr:MAG: hypothetical protein Pg6C_20170 [Treponemataceae bacterium]
MNPQNRALFKWYLTQETGGSVSLQEIAKEIVGRSALSLGDVRSVLSNLVDILPLFLKFGQSVRLEGFGSFHISVTSDGVENPADLNAHHIRNTRLVFVPGSELKKSLGDLSFEITP